MIAPNGGQSRHTPLARIEAGRRGRVINLHAEGATQAHLAAMGLLPGTEVEVLRSAPSGPFIVAVGGTRLILGRELTEKILVRPLP